MIWFVALLYIIVEIQARNGHFTPFFLGSMFGLLLSASAKAEFVSKRPFAGAQNPDQSNSIQRVKTGSTLRVVPMNTIRTRKHGWLDANSAIRLRNLFECLA